LPSAPTRAAPAGAAIGFAAGIICALAIRLKYRFGFDDTLDVVAVHGVGGITGLLATGLVATTAVNAATTHAAPARHS
jgi:Amt family ammonium transporter